MVFPEPDVGPQYPQPAVVLGPCGERHAVDRRVPHSEAARYRHSSEVRHVAMTNFLKFHGRETASEEVIEELSLGVTGWIFTDVRPWTSIEIGESMALGGPDVGGNCIAIRYEP